MDDKALRKELIELVKGGQAHATLEEVLNVQMASGRPMERKKLETILKSQVKNHVFDIRIVNLLIENFEEISTQVKEKQLISREVFEMKFSNIQAKINNN